MHWFYLYIVWFFPLLLVALACGRSEAGSARRSGNQHLLDRVSPSTRVDLDHGAHHPDVVLGGFEADRHLGDQRRERLLRA